MWDCPRLRSADTYEPHFPRQFEPGGATRVATLSGIPESIGHTELPRSNNVMSVPEPSNSTVAPSP